MAGITPITGIGAGGSGGGGGGGVTSVGAVSPVVSSGGTTPSISIPAATGASAGHMTAVQAAKVALLSGTNTGDQTSIVGITGTKAQFNTAVTDGDFLYAGEALAAANNLSDLASASTARTNLGLGTLATQSGTFSGTSSGTNTGDQASIVGITGTKAQFDTAVTDGNFLYSGDITQYTDELAQDAVGAMVDSTLVYTDGTPLLSRAALTGEATASAGSNAMTLTNSAVIGKVLTGYTSGAGTVAATDTILQAIQKLNGNDAATLTAAQSYADGLVTGLLDLKTGVDTSGNPNYPSALKGDAYYVTVAGKIGGASGVSVEVGDLYVASADNAGGTQAAVGSSWFVLEHNLVGALVASNNLSDLTNAATARTNLGLGTLATQSGTFSGTSSGTNTGDQTITLTGAVTGSGTGSFATSLGSFSSANLASALTDETGSGSAVFAVAPNLTGFVGINNASASGSLDVGAAVYNPGTISVSGVNVTGVGTEFTKTFKVGDSITTTTNNGTHTEEIQTITSDTVLTVVSSFTGTNSGAAYTSSNTGSQFVVLPNGGVRGMGTTGLSAVNTSDWLYKADTVSYTGSQLHSTFRDRTTYNPTGASTSTLNSIAAGPNLNATGSGGFTNVRAFNAFPTVVSTNTGNITTLAAFLSAAQVQSGATGTISNLIGFSFNSNNSSTTNTVTNMYGVSLTPTQNGGTLTSYAGVAVAAKPTAATNSSLLLLGTTTIPSGNYGIYNSSTNGNYLEGSLGIGILPVATTNVYMAKNIAGGATAYGFLQQAQIQSGTVTTSASYFHTVASTSAGTTSNVLHYETQQGTFTGAVTNQIGYRANSSLTGATNNYGFYGDIAAATGRYNFYAAGTAANYMAGSLGVGVVPAAGYKLDVFGTDAKIRVRDTGQSGGLEIYQQNSDGGSRIFAVNNNYLDFGTNNTTRMRLDSSGNLAIGSTTATEKLNIVSDGRNFLQMTRASTDVNQSVFSMRKARGTNAAPTIVVNGDSVGDTQYYAYDGANYINCAAISARVDGVPGVNDMPGRLAFSTTNDGASSPTEKLSIDSAGKVAGSASYVAHSTTAIPAGGTAGAGVMVSSTANFGVFFGSGVPTLSAAQGSLYLRSDGSSTSTRMYVNTNGTTGWTAVTTAT